MSERKWRELIERQRLSGESVRAFCRKHELRETSFYYWRRELKLRDREAASKRETSPAFAPVVLIEELGGPAPIEIVLKDGATVRVRRGATSEQLGLVLDALERFRC
mgnify:CR=1 FL=1